jgi:hypothetical protein
LGALVVIAGVVSLLLYLRRRRASYAG